MIVEASIRAAAALSDALDHRAWFARHRERRFSGNDGVGLIRRPRQGAAPDVYLHIAPKQTPKSDPNGELTVLWHAAPYNDWPIERCRKWVRNSCALHFARHGGNGRA